MRGLAGDRQQLAVAPEVFRPPLDLFARQPDRAVVVERLQRAEALVAHVQRFGRKLRLAEMTLQSKERAHTASARRVRPCARESDRSAYDVMSGYEPGDRRETGAGTTAARSRAMARRSLITATAVASPPAPAPLIAMSPGVHAADDRRILRTGRSREDGTARHDDRGDPGRERRPLAVVVGVRDLADRPAVPPRSLEVGRRDRRGRSRLDARRHRRAARTPARRGWPAWPPRRRRRGRARDPLPRSRARARWPGPRRASSPWPPSARARRSSCRSGSRPRGADDRPPDRRRCARTIGIAPPTAASNRSWRPWRAASTSSGCPARAMTCLLAVTTDLPASSASRIHPAAGSMPPMVSTMTSTSLREEIVEAGRPGDGGERPAGSARFCVARRSQMCVNVRPRTASCPVSRRATADPTVPKPRMPT